MQAVRLSDEARAAVNAAMGTAKPQPMIRADEVKALMAKGMKIAATRGHFVWAFAPLKIALACRVPYIAALPAAADLVDYMALGGEIVPVP
jgi:hypothetical protein